MDPARTKRDAELRTLLSQARFIPVLTLRDVERAAPLVRALADGGLRVVELTLRTAAAEACLLRVLDEVPEAVVGVGTVTSADDLALVRRVKPAFAVSPGVTAELLAEAVELEVPFLPGIATPSELMRAVEHGYRTVKFFPAETSGGPAALKALAGPFPDVAFCPTGGIGESRIGDYLTLPNVVAVGASWRAQEDELSAGDWRAVSRRAAELRKHVDSL